MCGKTLKIEPSTPPGDAPCPHCGHLLWFVRTESEETVIVGDMLVVELEAELIEMQIAELREGFGRSPRDRPLWLILDFQKLESISSLVLGRLITLSKIVERIGGRLSFRNVCTAVAEIFRICRLPGPFAMRSLRT